MTTYSIFAKPEDRYAQDAIFVSDRFSWGGFVFTGLWALWNRMWIVGAIVISVSLTGSALPPALQLLLSLAVSVLMGLHGNDLLAWSLARRGFREIGLCSGDSLEEAELRYYGDAAEIPSESSLALKDFDALGLFGAKS